MHFNPHTFPIINLWSLQFSKNKNKVNSGHKLYFFYFRSLDESRIRENLTKLIKLGDFQLKKLLNLEFPSIISVISYKHPLQVSI